MPPCLSVVEVIFRNEALIFISLYNVNLDATVLGFVYRALGISEWEHFEAYA